MLFKKFLAQWGDQTDIFWKFYSPADTFWSPKTMGRVLGYTTDFLPFYHPNNPENQNFEKTKKTPGDIIILHRSTTNVNHTYGSWDMKPKRLNFFVILGHFLPFTPLTAQKIKIKKKRKKLLEISSFYTSVSKIKISYAILFQRYGAWRM